MEVKAGRSPFTVEERVPPFLPINWMDWLGDEHVREMNETMWGVYFAILWSYGSTTESSSTTRCWPLGCAAATHGM